MHIDTLQLRQGVIYCSKWSAIVLPVDCRMFCSVRGAKRLFIIMCYLLHLTLFIPHFFSAPSEVTVRRTSLHNVAVRRGNHGLPDNAYTGESLG